MINKKMTKARSNSKKNKIPKANNHSFSNTQVLSRQISENNNVSYMQVP